ncbi:hypothetical protein PoB_002092800 [Plakobranchus ocellatus]|uniref:Uncharacterized protein n=1 Tax=Plakobranchus ocellatus TaxID=259542 RepID=A0AAV3ZIT8_9GAST|nr:hypothetical protein PoB_002092800 [Plakobranchus ocellatus]
MRMYTGVNVGVRDARKIGCPSNIKRTKSKLKHPVTKPRERCAAHPRSCEKEDLRASRYLQGKFKGKRSRGRQREKIMDGLATWLGPGKVSDILAAVKDRDLWRDMIANAYKQGT